MQYCICLRRGSHYKRGRVSTGWTDAAQIMSTNILASCACCDHHKRQVLHLKESSCDACCLLTCSTVTAVPTRSSISFIATGTFFDNMTGAFAVTATSSSIRMPIPANEPNLSGSSGMYSAGSTARTTPGSKGLSCPIDAVSCVSWPR